MISVDIYEDENRNWKIIGFCCGMHVPEMNDLSRVEKAVRELGLDKVLCSVYRFERIPVRKVCSIDDFYDWTFQECKN